MASIAALPPLHPRAITGARHASMLGLKMIGAKHESKTSQPVSYLASQPLKQHVMSQHSTERSTAAGLAWGEKVTILVSASWPMASTTSRLGMNSSLANDSSTLLQNGAGQGGAGWDGLHARLVSSIFGVWGGVNGISFFWLAGGMHERPSRRHMLQKAGGLEACPISPDVQPSIQHWPLALNLQCLPKGPQACPHPPDVLAREVCQLLAARLRQRLQHRVTGVVPCQAEGGGRRADAAG